MKHCILAAAILTLSTPTYIRADNATSRTRPALEEITVTAELVEASVLQLPNSVTVIEQSAIEQRNARHLEDLLNLAPNVNFATGASRGRFIQIRGIGERSEFQDPIINSVGVVVDGIDLTGIATAASALDVQQVEVLRGPQGTLFGANALAGLINIVSNDPSDSFTAKATLAAEELDGLELSGVVSGPVSDNAGYRFAVRHYESNGYNENVFLDRDDVSRLDETTARLRYALNVSEKLDLDLSVFLADIDNGYDAFSLDNTRQTYSDRPGFDRQETAAFSAKATVAINNDLRLQGLASAATSELQYAYDEDWSNAGICDGTPCDSGLFGFDWFYESFDQYDRDNDNQTFDLRLISSSENLTWIAGIYVRDQQIDLLRRYTFADSDFASSLDTQNTALYGQVKLALNNRWSLTTGLRAEQRDVDYRDNTGAEAAPNEDLWGGRIALEYLADNGAFLYGLVSRGYKPGGFNLDGDLATEQREFDTETMVNYELGLKQSYLDDALQIQAAVFYQDRNDIQSKQSIVSSIATGETGGTCPCNFTDFTDNANGGTNRGIELEAHWTPSENFRGFASLGLLDTEFEELLTFDHVEADRDTGVPFNLAGREQAHAPGYQWIVGGEYWFNRAISLSGSIEAKDDFYFSDRHEERSDAYELLNLELAYQSDQWRLVLYGKNLTDELVKTRGFGSFGNDPRKFYVTEPYNQYAAPRVVGVRASFEF